MIKFIIFFHFSTFCDRVFWYSVIEVMDMNIFEVTILNVLFISFPVLIYLVYVAYNQSFDRKENNLFLDVALFTSFYMCVRYSYFPILKLPVLIIHVPLIIAYVKDRNITAFFLSLLLVGYYYEEFQYHGILLLFEYVVCYGIYLWKYKKKFSDRWFVNMLLGFISIVYVYFLTIDGYFKQVNNQELFVACFVIVMFFLMGNILFYLFIKGEEIMKIHMNMKELEHEKQVRTSIFKITHEIKNPIAVCKGYLDMFDPNNQNHSFQYIPIIKEEINRTLVLLQDYLSFNKITIEKDILDIHLLLFDVVDSLKLLFKEYNVCCDVNVSDDEVFIEGDYNRLTQVVINVIKNSLEAMDSKCDGKICIYTKIVDNEIQLFFDDNGVGIDSDTLKRIKEPFFTTKQKGTGLGVCISDEIISAHGGNMYYDSIYGEGTSVKIQLPILSSFS